MKPTLTLVPQSPNLAQASGASPAPYSACSHRKLFWSAFLTWLASATDDESEQLERALAPHAHHVRPLEAAVSDAVKDAVSRSKQRDATPALPPTLLASLVAVGWRPLPTDIAPSRSAGLGLLARSSIPQSA